MEFSYNAHGHTTALKINLYISPVILIIDLIAL